MQSTRGVISLVALGLILVCTSTLMFVHDLQEPIVKLILAMSKGTIFFKLWSAPPYDVYLKVYIFNITNEKGFLNNEEKMNVTEIGPYTYREILTNENATFNDEDGTVTYHPNRIFEFVPEMSVGDVHTDFIYTTNIVLVGLQAYLKTNWMASWSFGTVTKTMGSKAIIKLTINEFLWGYQDPLVRYANNFFPKWIDFQQFGIFDRLLSRDNGNTVTIVKDPSKYRSEFNNYLTDEEKLADFHVVQWNNMSGLKDWGYEKLSKDQIKKCHLVEGVFDGTVFPRNMPENRTLTLFRKAFCRPVPLVFQRENIGEAGFRQYEYGFPDDMFEYGKECFCPRGNCAKGFQTIAPCYYDIPISISQPHFLNADPSALKTINGLTPDATKHGSMCAIQPELGIPLSGSLKIQVNLDIEETRGNSLTKPFHHTQVPLLWLEITSPKLPFMVKLMLLAVCTLLPAVLVVTKYLLILGGLAMISGAALYTLMKTKVTIPNGPSGNEYTAVPIISLPVEFLEKRFSIK